MAAPRAGPPVAQQPQDILAQHHLQLPCPDRLGPHCADLDALYRAQASGQALKRAGPPVRLGMQVSQFLGMAGCLIALHGHATDEIAGHEGMRSCGHQRRGDLRVHRVRSVLSQQSIKGLPRPCMGALLRNSATPAKSSASA